MLAITSAAITLALVVQPIPSAGPATRLRVIADTEARTLGLPSLTPTERAAAASVFGALLGASVCTLAGAEHSASTADHSLALLSGAGMFDQDVLFTDLLMKGVDAGNVAGYAVLALAVMMLAINPEAWQVSTQMAVDEIDACLIDDFGEGHICGPSQMLEDMLCVADSDGLQWVCA